MLVVVCYNGTIGNQFIVCSSAKIHLGESLNNRMQQQQQIIEKKKNIEKQRAHK